jgi:hypothetical protein
MWWWLPVRTVNAVRNFCRLTGPRLVEPDLAFAAARRSPNKEPIRRQNGYSPHGIPDEGFLAEVLSEKVDRRIGREVRRTKLDDRPRAFLEQLDRNAVGILDEGDGSRSAR